MQFHEKKFFNLFDFTNFFPLGLTVWAKNNNRWCFTPPEPRRDEFDQVPTVEDPIIKESSKPSSNEEPSKPKEQEEPTDNPV